MAVAVITGSAGLVGSETVRFFGRQCFDVIGIDNDSRQSYFGPDASTSFARHMLEVELACYRHHYVDIRDENAISSIFASYGKDIHLVVHTAGQPSHDWADRNPQVDFAVNATGTLILLEATRRHCPDAVFLFTSSNKVYGDNPNKLPLVELPTRWELEACHPYGKHGIDENLSVDQTQHSLFGVSKLAADSLVQEYGRRFHLRTTCFRAGCLTGPGHAANKLHGFLAYLARCVVCGHSYQVLGHQGKQVRDNMHAADLVNAFWHVFQNPRHGEVYNVGGGRYSHSSLVEAIALCEETAKKKLTWAYVPEHRAGDHIWYVSDMRKFQAHYPAWSYQYDLPTIVRELCAK
jgi:CDP-paratose 2-epimerase